MLDTVWPAELKLTLFYLRLIYFVIFSFKCSTSNTLRTFAPKIFRRSVFSKVSLQLDNDQLMSEKQNIGGLPCSFPRFHSQKNSIFSRSEFFCFWTKCREQVKEEMGHRAFERVKHVYRCRNTHHHFICLYF